MRWYISLAALTLTGCATPLSRIETRDAIVAYDETGIASWYGEEVAGNRTASGTRFGPEAITVAHRTLPLGSFVAVTALDTGRSIVALVDDRGPARADRLVDLSRSAAHQLGTDIRPLARVRVQAVVVSADEAKALRAGWAARPRAKGARPIRVAAAPIPASGGIVVRIATFASQSCRGARDSARWACDSGKWLVARTDRPVCRRRRCAASA